MTRRKKTIIAFGIVAFIICRSGKKRATTPQVAKDSTTADSAAIHAAAKDASVERESAAPVAYDSIPFEARTALRFDARTFVLYRRNEYDSTLIATYPWSGNNGLTIVRANLRGLGDDYVVAGRNLGSRSVIAITRRSNTGGWVLRSVTGGEGGTRVPLDSASVWIRREPHGHPNGVWDAVVVHRLYATDTDKETMYYWDPGQQLFVSRGGALLIIH